MRRVRWRPVVVPVMLLCVVLAGAPVAAADDIGGSTAQLDAATLAAPGPYEVEAREVVVTRPDDENGDVEARLFVPLASSGIDVDGAAMSPIVAFGHGYLTPVELYESTLRHLASWGITTIAPRSGGGLLPDHAAFADDLADAAGWVALASEEPDWPGLPADGEALAVSGHSMGGGAAVLAAAGDERIRAVATLAAADTRPSSIEAAAALTVPSLFIAGSDDGLTPVEAHQRPMFGAISGVPAQLRIIEGGSHCGFLDEAILVGIVCDEASIRTEVQLAHARSALVAWLRHELAADGTTADVAWPAAPAPGISVETTDARAGN